MGRKAAYTPEQLAGDLQQGLKLQDMAAKYGVDISNISRAVKKLKMGAAVAADPAVAGKVFEAAMTAMAMPSAPALKARTKHPKGNSAASRDEISMWQTKAALDDNFNGLRELLDKRRHPFLDGKTILLIRREMRGHIMDGVRILETVYATQEQEAFEEFVLEELDAIDPAARKRITDNMRQRRPLREVRGPDRGTLRPDGD